MLSLSSTVIALSGCTAIQQGTFPDTQLQTQASLGTIKGSNFGGHAPLVGSHVYVLQAATTGYGAQVTSLIGSTNSSNGYAPTENISDPSIPTTGTGTPWYYVTTDSTGQFNITGDYTCTSGYPVYLYAYGGLPGTIPSANNFTVTKFVPQTANVAGSTVLFTVSTTESFTAGQQVTLSGFTGNYALLNGQSGPVLSTNLTSTTFELSGITGDPAGAVGVVGTTYTATGTATVNPSFNPGAINMAMLGICPSSGNFSTGGTLPSGATFAPLSYIYMNEVSTVALAYSMAGFGTDGLHIGTSTAATPTLTAPGIIGIQNAAANAANLYDIGGHYSSTVPVGEGHIANPTTFSGGKNGTVPQAELDTLGNILAACVDSNNTYQPVAATGTLSPQCNTLFTGASSNGGNTGGTKAPSTATAAFNIAHYPMTASVVALYTLPTGSVPFTPNLGAQPNDFTVGIIYSSTANSTSGATATASLASPTGVAIDSSGNAYISATTSGSSSTITRLSSLGVSTATSTAATGATVPGYMSFLALDQSGNVWATTTGSAIGGQTGNGFLFKFNNALSTVSQVATGLYAPTSIAIDKSNNVFIGQNNGFAGGTYGIAEFAGGGTVLNEIVTPCGQRVTSLTVDTIGTTESLWTSTNNSNTTCIVSTAGATNTSVTSISNNYNISLDGSGNGWFSNHNQTNLYRLGPTGTLTAFGKGTGNNQNSNIAGLYDPAWSAIDGAGNIFALNDNGANSSVSEISNTGVALSCPLCFTQGNTLFGYQPGNITSVTATTMNSFYTGYIAVDPSGDLWVANYNNSTILEIIGVGTPVVTPLSSQKYGIAP